MGDSIYEIVLDNWAWYHTQHPHCSQKLRFKWQTCYVCVNLGYQCLMGSIQWFTFLDSFFVILDLNPTWVCEQCFGGRRYRPWPWFLSTKPCRYHVNSWVVRPITTLNNGTTYANEANVANNNVISYRFYLLYRHLCMVLSYLVHFIVKRVYFVTSVREHMFVCLQNVRMRTARAR